MNVAPIESNPFAMLISPDDVIARVSASPRLAMLNSRICRPLDKPFFGQGLPEPEPIGDALDALIGEDDD